MNRRSVLILFLAFQATLALAGVSRAAEPETAPVATPASEPATNSAATTRAASGLYKQRPAAPTGLSANTISFSEVDLSWPDTVPNAKRYRLERCMDRKTWWEEIASLPAGTKNYTFVDDKCAPSTSYSYRLFATTDTGETQYSSTVSVLTYPPGKTTRTLQSVVTEGQAVTFRELLSPAFWQGSVKELVSTAVSFIPKVIVALLLFATFWAIYRGVRRVVFASMKKANVDTSIRDMLGGLIKWSILGFGLVIACNQVGIQITALLTGVSIIGLAVGFAAQDTISNFISGVVIFWDKPFKVGDWVTVDGQFGRVLRVSFRSTRLLNTEGQTIVMPNAQMLNKQVSNHTTHSITRVNIPVSIGANDSLDDVRAALLATTRNDERIVPDPAPSVVVTSVDGCKTGLMLRFWVRDESIERQAFHEYLEKAKRAMDSLNEDHGHGGNGNSKTAAA